MNSRWLIPIFSLFIASTQAENKTRTAELKLANVELARNATILMSSDEANNDSGLKSMAEQLYQMVFKRSAKKEKEEKEESGKKEEEKKDENDDSKTTTTTPSTTKEEHKHEKSHHKKGHHKKHKHHHKHHKSGNETDIDWHSIG